VAVNIFGAFINQVRAQGGNHILTSCTLGGVTFNPVTVLISDATGLIDSLDVSAIPNPVTGYILNSGGLRISGATVSVTDSGGHTIATAVSDVTGFYFFATTGVLTTGSSYTVEVTTFPTGFGTSSPASQTLTEQGTAITLADFDLS